MLNSRQYNSQTALQPRNKIRTLKVGYTASQKKGLKYALNYVLQQLNFQAEYLPDPEFQIFSLPVRAVDGNGNELYIDTLRLEEDPETPFIIFYTDNCLRDYFKYLQSGVEFTNRPHYCSKGLKAEFLAPDNSCYTLLEKRIYSENDIF